MSVEILPPPTGWKYANWPPCCCLITINGGHKQGDHGTWCRKSGKVVWDWGSKINVAKDEDALRRIFDA